VRLLHRLSRPMNYTLPILTSIVLSLSAFTGLLLAWMRPARMMSLSGWLVAFAAGALLGNVCLHLLPHAYLQLKNPWAVGGGLLAGILLFVVLDQVFRHRHRALPDAAKRAVPLVLIGDGLHNFLDGMVLATAFLVDEGAGLAVGFAILLHELPQEIGDFGVLIRGGMKWRRALLWNLLSALTAVLGVLLGLWLGESSQAIANMALPVAAGALLYLALGALIPSLNLKQDKHPAGKVLMLILGLVLLGGLHLWLHSPFALGPLHGHSH